MSTRLNSGIIIETTPHYFNNGHYEMTSVCLVCFSSDSGQEELRNDLGYGNVELVRPEASAIVIMR